MNLSMGIFLPLMAGAVACGGQTQHPPVPFGASGTPLPPTPPLGNCPANFDGPETRVWRGQDGIVLVHLPGREDGLTCEGVCPSGFFISAHGKDYYALHGIGFGRGGDAGATRWVFRAPGVAFSVTVRDWENSVYKECLAKGSDPTVSTPLNRLSPMEAGQLLSQAVCKDLPAGFLEAWRFYNEAGFSGRRYRPRRSPRASGIAFVQEAGSKPDLLKNHP